MKHLERTLKALANLRRLGIVKELKKAKRGLPVGALAQNIELKLRTTSKHLAILTAAGIVEGHRKGMQVLYCLSSDQNNAAKRILDLL